MEIDEKELETPSELMENIKLEGTPDGEEPLCPGSQIKASENDVSTRMGPKYTPALFIKGHASAVTSAKFSPNGQFIATSSDDCIARIWDTSTGRLWLQLQGHIGGISDCSWAPDGQSLATVSDDKTIRIWDTETGRQLRVMRGHTYYVTCADFNYKGNLLASGSADENVKIWDVKQAKCLRTLAAHSDAVTSVRFSRDGTILVSSSNDGLIRLWDTASGHCLRTIVVQTKSPVTFVRFSPNCKYILATTLDGSLRLWDYMRDKCVRTFNRNGVEFKYSSPSVFIMGGSDIYIVQASASNVINLWDVDTKKLATVLKGHDDAVLGLDYNEERDLIVSGGKDCNVILWKREH